MAAHDLLSPSGAHRWMACPGSAAMVQAFGVETKSEHADEGTRAHELAELAAKELFAMIDTEEFEQAAEEGGYDDEMREGAKAWRKCLRDLVICDRRVADLRSICGVERRIDLEPVTKRPGACGTADFFALDSDGTLTVADYKYGRGVEVEAERNPQLTIYALGLMRELELDPEVLWDVKSVRLVICQPRICAEPKVFTWGMDALAKFSLRVREAAREADALLSDIDEAQQHLVPGTVQCRFCSAKASCPALRAKTQEIVKAEFADIDQKAPQVPATVAELAKVLPYLDLIEKWCTSVREAALARAMQGETVPGYKVVEGRKGARKWLPDAEEKIRSMRIKREVIYERALMSPTKLQKAFKAGQIGPRQWAQIEQLIGQADGKPQLVPESDKRPAIAVSLKDDFKTID